MPDCSQACITIGGHIANIKDFEALIDAVLEERAGVDWGETAKRDDAIEQLLSADKNGKPALYFDDESPGGLMGSIASACHVIGLPYKVSQDGHFTYPASTTLWRKGMPAPIECHGSTEEEPAPTMWYLRTALADGQTLAHVVRTIDEIAKVPPLTIAKRVRARYASHRAVKEVV